MAQKRSIIIYTIPIRKLNNFNQQSTQRLVSNYLIGVDSTDILVRNQSVASSSAKIEEVYITSQNFPPIDNINAEGYYRVLYENNNPYIQINSKNYYIYNSNVVQSDLLTDSREIFTFYVNPDRITPRYQKLQTEIRTLGGWEIQHWGNQLLELAVDGKTGGMHTVDSQGKTRALNENESIEDSKAWKKLVQLRTIYEKDQSRRNKQPVSLLGLSYLDGLYIGYFTTFVGPIPDAEKPYNMSFNFTFKVQEIIYNSEGALNIEF
jgi:hypothetical protein